MRIKEKYDGDIVVLSIAGKLMGGPETQELHEHVSALAEKGTIKVIIDLSKVKWLNSGGLGVLMASFATLAKVKGNLKLACATDKVQSLLMITQLLSFFQTYETVDRAIASFKSGK